MPQPVSNTLTVVSGSLLANKISYVVDGQNRNYRGGFGGLSWMSEAPSENNVIFIGNTTNIGRGPAGKPLFYPSFNTTQANVVYAVNKLPGSPGNFNTTASAYNWATTNNFFINNSNNPIPRIDADGLVLYVDANQPTSYPQTGTSWYDMSGVGNSGTLGSGISWNSNGWMYFNGTQTTNYQVAIPINRGQLGDNMSIEATFKYEGSSGAGYRPIIGGNDPGSGTEFFLGKNSGNNYFGVQDGNYDGAFVTGYDVFDGRWHHMIYTYNNNTGELYLDGVLRNSGYFSKCNDGEQIYIGAEVQEGYWWQGNISQVKYYTQTLSQAEVKQNYFQSNIVTSSLSYLWDANNIVSYPKSGTIVYNLTGSISGSLTNGTGYTNSNGGSWTFDGVDDYILLENSLTSITPGNGNWTLSAWVKGPWSSGTYYPIVGNTSGGPVASGFAVYQNKIYYQNYDGSWQSHYGNTTLNPNTWYHFTWVNYAGASAALGTMKMYVNAVADSSTFNSYTTNGGPVNAIGSAYNGAFSGNIASVQWNIGTAFTDQQVAQQYEATKDKFQGATIPLNGLVLNLDAANKDSYPGTGTTWYDLSGNSNNGTLLNGTSWSSFGYMSTDAVDDYIQIADAASLRFTTGFTQVIWVKFNNTITDYYRNLFGKPNYVCYGMIVEWYGGNPILYDFLVGGNRNALGLNYPGSNWVMVAQSYNASGGSNNQIGYINGGASNVLYATRTGNVDINTEPMNIGQSGLSMNVGLALAYNRGLTLAELNQIYNATKTRFGY